MKLRDFLHKLGSSFLSFGSFLVMAGKEDWQWWLGAGLVVVGPLMQMANKSAPKIPETVPETTTNHNA